MIERIKTLLRSVGLLRKTKEPEYQIVPVFYGDDPSQDRLELMVVAPNDK